MATPGEIEVYRISTVVDKCYKHAEYTRSTGKYPNERYFFKGEPKYVGKKVASYRRGSGDGQEVWDIFNDNGITNRVDYSYLGKTSFIEVPCQEEPTAENRSRKSSMMSNLLATPPMGIYPGGKNYHSAKANFEQRNVSGGKQKRSRKRHTKRRRGTLRRCI
jgi:hypothetical protein